ncbi:hypothetical protein DPMN_144012 [Dreissena polymorpha]|uniref:Uncharacterized protein n=1 Tax=Dreissena polymorpha TaxID=45954 RepID=A0A9D4GHD8_DREPO|nr:hypothetical protein DPMN_144012 [Dreissena polymorpha]
MEPVFRKTATGDPVLYDTQAVTLIKAEAKGENSQYPPAESVHTVKTEAQKLCIALNGDISNLEST